MMQDIETTPAPLWFFVIQAVLSLAIFKPISEMMSPHASGAGFLGLQQSPKSIIATRIKTPQLCNVNSRM